MIFLLLSVLLTTASALCPQTKTTATQVPLTLYSFGTPATSSYAHILSSDPNLNSSANAMGISLRTEYAVSGTTITTNSSADCPSECLYSLYVRFNYNSSYATAAMARPTDLYPGLNTTMLTPVLCATTLNYCGADTPLFVYYNNYYVSTDGSGPSSSASAYPAATVAPSITPGIALCYVWSIVTTTTQSTTTNTASTTTPKNTTVNGTTVAYNGTTTAFNGTTAVFNGTTTVSSGNVTTVMANGTTVASNGTTKATTVAGVTTVRGGGGTTASGGSGVTGATESSSSSSGSTWWRIPVIAVGVLLLVGVVIGLLALATLSFINPAPPKKAVSPYSPQNANVLPPTPVNALPAPQPLTVGPSMGYTPVF